jgi:hypothetical protein
MADFEVFSQKGLGYEKVASTTRMEDGEKVLENYQKGFIVNNGHAVSHKNVRPTEIEKRLRRRPPEDAPQSE